MTRSINFSGLRQSMNTYFTELQLEGTVYFEYLPTGTSIRVGDDRHEVAASLIKVPIAMELYKAAELSKIDLDREITLEPGWLDSEFGDLYKKGAGYKLTLRDAAKIMITESDNTALKAVAYSLVDKLKPEENVFDALDVEYSINNDMTISLNARAYSSILKCLYFSCYLNHDNSQQLLKLMSESKFDNRLVAGIANKNLTIAHKIGVYTSGEVQSDCGIIYLENRNYLLCVMIRGLDDDTTNIHIAALSKLAYDYLVSR